MRRRTFEVFGTCAAAHLMASAACVCGGMGYIDTPATAGRRWEELAATLLTFPVFPLWELLVIAPSLDWLLLPLLLANSAFWGTLAAAGYAVFTRQSVPQPGRCRRCGYDLRATPDRCPECGIATTRAGE